MAHGRLMSKLSSVLCTTCGTSAQLVFASGNSPFGLGCIRSYRSDEETIGREGIAKDGLIEQCRRSVLAKKQVTRVLHLSC